MQLVQMCQGASLCGQIAIDKLVKGKDETGEREDAATPTYRSRPVRARSMHARPVFAEPRQAFRAGRAVSLGPCIPKAN